MDYKAGYILNAIIVRHERLSDTVAVCEISP